MVDDATPDDAAAPDADGAPPAKKVRDLLGSRPRALTITHSRRNARLGKATPASKPASKAAAAKPVSKASVKPASRAGSKKPASKVGSCSSPDVSPTDELAYLVSHLVLTPLGRRRSSAPDVGEAIAEEAEAKAEAVVRILPPSPYSMVLMLWVPKPKSLPCLAAPPSSPSSAIATQHSLNRRDAFLW